MAVELKTGGAKMMYAYRAKLALARATNSLIGTEYDRSTFRTWLTWLPEKVCVTDDDRCPVATYLELRFLPDYRAQVLDPELTELIDDLDDNAHWRAVTAREVLRLIDLLAFYGDAEKVRAAIAVPLTIRIAA